MRYTVEDGGRLNNFAVEPKMYQADEPTAADKKSYVLFGGIAIALLGGIVAITLAASQVG